MNEESNNTWMRDVYLRPDFGNIEAISTYIVMIFRNVDIRLTWRHSDFPKVRVCMEI